MKKECEIIQDLLPLYYDKIASNSSSQLVEEHLSNCVECQERYDTMNEEAISKQSNQTINIKKLQIKVKAHLWKRVAITILITIVVLPLMLIFYMSFIANEGLTFEAIAAHWKAQQAFDAIVSQDYERAVDYLGFWGYSWDRTEMGEHLVEQEKTRWIENMKRYDDQYRILEANVSRSSTDDGFTHAYVELRIADNSGVYEFLLKIAYYGKNYKRANALYPVDIYPNYNRYLDLSDSAREKIERVGYALLDVIYTYNPG